MSTSVGGKLVLARSTDIQPVEAAALRAEFLSRNVSFLNHSTDALIDMLARLGVGVRLVVKTPRSKKVA
jgi:hypothetical protein